MKFMILSGRKMALNDVIQGKKKKRSQIDNRSHGWCLLLSYLAAGAQKSVQLAATAQGRWNVVSEPTIHNVKESLQLTNVAPSSLQCSKRKQIASSCLWREACLALSGGFCFVFFLLSWDPNIDKKLKIQREKLCLSLCPGCILSQLSFQAPGQLLRCEKKNITSHNICKQAREGYFREKSQAHDCTINLIIVTASFQDTWYISHYQTLLSFFSAFCLPVWKKYVSDIWP